jgi:hypothetical protein
MYAHLDSLYMGTENTYWHAMHAVQSSPPLGEGERWKA